MSFTLKENFWRELLVRPFSAGGGDSHRSRNSAGLDVTFHPGGGALVFELSYDMDIVLYDSLSLLDDMQHKLRFMFYFLMMLQIIREHILANIVFYTVIKNVKKEVFQ